MKKPLGTLLVTLASLVFFGNGTSATANEFYAGKTIRVSVGFSAGGGTTPMLAPWLGTWGNIFRAIPRWLSTTWTAPAV